MYGPPELQHLLLAACRTAQLQLTSPVECYGWVLDPARAAPLRAVDPAGMLRFGLVAPDQAPMLSPEQAASWQQAYDAGSDQVGGGWL